VSWLNNAVFSRYDPSIAVVEADGQVNCCQMASPAQYSAQHNLPPHLAPYTYHFPSSPYSSPHHSSSYPTLPTSASYGYGRGDLPSDRQVYCFASDALFEGIIAHVTQSAISQNSSSTMHIYPWPFTGSSSVSPLLETYFSTIVSCL